MLHQQRHLLDPTAHQLPGLLPARLLLSREAARSYAQQQALTELRRSHRTLRPGRVSVLQRARRLARRTRAA